MSLVPTIDFDFLTRTAAVNVLQVRNLRPAASQRVVMALATSKAMT
jgi:hypothetical protein